VRVGGKGALLAETEKGSFKKKSPMEKEGFAKLSAYEGKSFSSAREKHS